MAGADRRRIFIRHARLQPTIVRHKADRVFNISTNKELNAINCLLTYLYPLMMTKLQQTKLPRTRSVWRCSD